MYNGWRYVIIGVTLTSSRVGSRAHQQVERSSSIHDGLDNRDQIPTNTSSIATWTDISVIFRRRLFRTSPLMNQYCINPKTPLLNTLIFAGDTQSQQGPEEWASVVDPVGSGSDRQFIGSVMVARALQSSGTSIHSFQGSQNQ